MTILLIYGLFMGSLGLLNCLIFLTTLSTLNAISTLFCTYIFWKTGGMNFILDWYRDIRNRIYLW